jgi:hypothetical protein
LIWLVVGVALAVDAGAALGFGGQSAIFFAANNLVQLLVVVGVTNSWAQSGLKARDAAILGGALIIYDYVFTSLLPLMGDLFSQLQGLPFAPLVGWPLPGGQWLAIGLGDLLLATVFPLVMRKAYSRQAGLVALALGLAAIGGLMLLPILGWQPVTFPVMVVLGPLMVLQYLYWRHRCGQERTTWQYRQTEARPVIHLIT